MATMLLIALGVVMILWSVYRVAERRFYTVRMPPQLELGWRFWHDGENHIFSGCGVAAFSLTETTVEAIERRGLAFFANVTESRSQERHARRRFGGWRPTPVPASFWSDGVPPEFACADWLDPYLKHRALAAMQRPGGYYTATEPRLIVLPSEGVVLFTYFD